MSKQQFLGISNSATGLLLAALLISPALADTSPDGLWSDTPVTTTQARSGTPAIPKRYRAVSLSVPDMQTVLSTAPMEQRGQIGASLYLPMPDGSFKEFLVEFSPVMAPGLAAKFPEITTYRTVAVGDSATRGRLDFTPAGFHAMITGPDGTVFIDPASKASNTSYVSYNKHDATPPEKPWQCLVEDDDKPIAAIARFDPAQALGPNLPSGATLRTYELAVAATAEYSAFHGGTKALSQAAIVTAINRVNEIYNRDLAIHLELIANNDDVVYIGDPLADPFTNNDGFAMLGENQTNMDAVIGDANYDIGHVFSTGGGGVATLNSPCDSGVKARGVTGLGSPIGDPFYIDFVSHEIGHQFDGRHTFNGTTGNCGGSNRSPSAAFEPGSGSTIQAYAGICGAENLQFSSDANFHTHSFQEIVTYTTGANQGNTCDAETATGNSVPVPDAGAAFTIPVSTPFMLTGSATDADGGDVLTYSWEQYDLGSASPPNTDNGNRPIFRSFPPSLSPTRIFPQVSDIANGTSTLGESLPTTDRTLTFRMTVRDNALGGGGVDYDTVVLTSSTSSGPFDVTSQSSPTNWTDGNTETITWNVANTTAAPVSCALVDIDFSDDGGLTFATNLLTGTPNDGSEDITVPNVPTLIGRVRVKCSDNIFFDFNSAAINIASPECYLEDFGAGPALPAGWTIFNNGALALDWGMTNDAVCGTNNGTPGNFTGGTGEAACVDSDVAGNGVVNSYLCSPAIDLTAVSGSTLSFLYNYQIFSDPTGEDLFAVLLGTTAPSAGTIGGFATEFSTSSNQGSIYALPGAFEQINTSAYDGAPVYVCFQYGADFDWYAQVDDVRINALSCNNDPNDTDGDGVPNVSDNCPNDPNPNQEDFDGDGAGYACDTSCASIIDFMYTFSNGEMFELLAAGKVKFSGTMDAGSDIIFDGNNGVTLKTDTAIKQGALFRARSDGCTP